MIQKITDFFCFFNFEPNLFEHGIPYPGQFPVIWASPGARASHYSVADHCSQPSIDRDDPEFKN